MSEETGQPHPLRTEAETRLAGSSSLAPPALSKDQLLHELQVHQIELEMQKDELRRSQTALEESRARYFDLYDLAPVGYVTLTDTGLIDEINLTGAALLGDQRQRLLRRRFAQFVVPEHRDCWYRTLRGALQSENRQRSELTLQRVDDQRLDVQLDCRRITKPDGVQCLRMTVTDISERKRAEEEQRIAAIAFESQEAIMVTDAAGVILRVNRAFTQLTGYSAAEAIGNTPAMLRSGMHDETFYQGMWESLKQKHFWQDRMWNRRKNGSVYLEWQTISAVLAEDGSVSHYVSSFCDISEREKLKNEIRDQRQEMESLQRTQIASQTAAAIAHDLNQPLLAIATYSSAALMLLNAETPDIFKIRKAIAASEQQAHRAGKSIRQLIEYLSIKEFSVDPFDLNKEIIDVLDNARSEHELQFHSKLDLDDTLPLVKANRTHVRKALANLLCNSIEAMQEAGIPLPSITVSVRTEKDIGVARATIQDNGPGPRQEDIPHLFKPFFTTKRTGIGMGLSISRALIEANGGQLWIDQNRKSGATFHLTLPLAS